MTTLYETLGVKPDATAAQIKSAYKKLAMKWHPDRNLDNTEDAGIMMQLVQQAYDVLSDPKLREQYDLSGTTTQAPDPHLEDIGILSTIFAEVVGNTDEDFLDYLDLINAVKNNIRASKETLLSAIENNKRAIRTWQKVIEKLKVAEGKTNYVAESFKAKITRFEQENIFSQMQVDRADRMITMADDYTFETVAPPPQPDKPLYRINPMFNRPPLGYNTW